MYLKYTLCFCRAEDRLLMLLRRKPPHAGQWNGVGGKIEAGESARHGVIREVLEEAGINLADARKLSFAGIVTWRPEDAVNGQGAGMYVYVAEFAAPSVAWPGDRVVVDGTLRWQPVTWVCDPQNSRVVANIPAFLPPMLRQEPPRDYYCDFESDVLLSVQPRPLPQALDEDAPAADQSYA
jgi:8-oxo-dGTP diphosphatase